LAEGALVPQNFGGLEKRTDKKSIYFNYLAPPSLNQKKISEPLVGQELHP
jgi:hypothetical protein